MGKKKANTTSGNKEVAPRTDPRAKEELRQKLKSKIGEKQIQRSSKDHRKKVWEETLTDFGLDHEKFKEDMERLQKEQSGGMEMRYRK